MTVLFLGEERAYKQALQCWEVVTKTFLLMSFLSWLAFCKECDLSHSLRNNPRREMCKSPWKNSGSNRKSIILILG